MISLATALALGLLLGMRHAFEPDHLAAVSTLVTRHGSPRIGAVLGACWGLGHTLALLAVGCVLAVVDSRLPAGLADGFELLVAAMLFALGSRAIARAVRARPEPSENGHGGGAHAPAGSSGWRVARQPLVVGVIHGLAGSGALTALVLARLPTVTTRLVYIALFGLGSILGMACLTGIAGWPLARLQRRADLSRVLSFAAGGFSALLGVGWGWTVLRGLLHA